MRVEQSEVSDRHRNAGALKQVLLPADGVPAAAASLLLLLLLLSIERVELLVSTFCPLLDPPRFGNSHAGVKAIHCRAPPQGWRVVLN